MTVQPEDIEPEDAAPAGDWRHDTSFQWPEMVPWSQLGPDFIQSWGFELPRNKR
jgi:hypothetical protein